MQMVNESGIRVENITIHSGFLQRIVKIDLYQPEELSSLSELSLLLINDGQDMEKMRFTSILDELYDRKEIRPFLTAAIHCGTERKREYGIAAEADYKGRGDKAGLYTSFVMQELIPVLHIKYDVSRFAEKVFAGFSLGALSAMDIVWNHPDEFKTAGCFSSSFWWRSIDQLHPDYDDHKHRIMHQQVRRGNYHPSLKFFFQCGNMDETRDRNKNGIIDSIDDTLDIIKELEGKGYKKEKDIHYLELADGHHDVHTWGRAMPEFLKWGFGK
ncbi:MAG: esterase [Chitinophagaceae bacterium]|nr:esterase [Chitinophagaceae bacterium]